MLNALTGVSGDKGRDTLIEHANILALRKGPWKLIAGGKKPAANEAEPGDKAPAPAAPNGVKLFNLANDPGEEKNIAKDHPDVVKEMSEMLEKLKEDGRSRPKVNS